MPSTKVLPMPPFDPGATTIKGNHKNPGSTLDALLRHRAHFLGWRASTPVEGHYRLIRAEGAYAVRTHNDPLPPWPLFVVRGLPGSGKTYMAEGLIRRLGALTGGPAASRSADDYFIQGGQYVFRPEALPEAHEHCQRAVSDDLAAHGIAFVANTFTQQWELDPYITIAGDFNTYVYVIDMFDGGGLSNEDLAARNRHEVPVATIAKMRDRWEPKLRTEKV